MAADERSETTLFVLVGLPGSGKTTRAVELEGSGSARLSPDDWMLPLFGDVEAPRQRDVVEGQLVNLACRLLRLGVSVTLDFGVWSIHERCALRELARQLGVGVALLYLPIDRGEQRDRLFGRSATPGGYSFTEDDLERYRRSFEAPTPAEFEASHPFAVPDAFDSWAAWAAHRWPGLAWPSS